MVSKKKIKVRRAEPRDIVNIAKLLHEGWNEATTEFAPIDDVCGYRWILGILEEGFVVVADLNGRIIGAACANPYRPPWSRQWLIDMSFLYVLPSFRKDDVAGSLIRAVERFADNNSAPLTLRVNTEDRPLVKDRMMKMAGWNYIGGNFLRKTEDGSVRQQENDDS